MFYTLQGFQGYLICKFWPSRLFYIDFTRSAQKLEFENLNSNEFDSIDPRLTRAGDMAARYWLIPIQVRPFNPGHWMQIERAEKKREGVDSPAMQSPARASKRSTSARFR
jgi:hypothetical protein